MHIQAMCVKARIIVMLITGKRARASMIAFYGDFA